MNAHALQTIELLSLEIKQGRYWMELAIARDSRQTIHTYEIDEISYNSLQQQEPFSADKARLSLRKGWDPYRQTHYGMLIKTNRSLSETRYYTCTESFGELLDLLKDGDLLKKAVSEQAEPEADEQEAVAGDSPALRPDRVRSKKRSARGALYMTGRLALLAVLFFFAWFEFENHWFTDDAEGLSESPVIATVADASESEVYAKPTVVQASDIGPEDAYDYGDPTVAGNEEAETALLPLFETVQLEAGVPYYSLPKGYVGLTFDDGPSEYTKQIVDLLKEHEIAGTFLFVGRQAERYPEEAAYAAEQGMAVGNHSWDHSNLTLKKAADMAANIDKAGETLAKLTDKPVSVFRPPYGAMNDTLIASVAEQELKLLMWNRDPEDWRADSAEHIVSYFKKHDPSGGIYVLHEKKATLEALPAIIEYIKELGLTFAVFE